MKGAVKERKGGVSELYRVLSEANHAPMGKELANFPVRCHTDTAFEHILGHRPGVKNIHPFL